ncbi:transcriptional regulator [Wenjunlia tyrosinilytica]|uniref:Uncharacterized protein n=1 Tax=Wenjunlia tyrosinilytica TaxID=1544741 RepID=A0A917ZUT0_9ACTN|nr:transcriptional regulator [Wenjunlia tyrosinilytica]GGO92836.1 hypothetical protein GCM10012280_43920 [Wenjunlia tyrosinilytica]
MARSAWEAVEAVQRELAPESGANRLVGLIAEGKASRRTLGALAAEQRHIVSSDRRSFLHLAARSPADSPVAEFFEDLARGESEALGRLTPFAVACGHDGSSLRSYEPQPGCQGYPAYMAWMALNADPTSVPLALTANFAAWGGYCATVSEALERHYGFGAQARGFFDFFAEPDPEVQEKSLRAVQWGLDMGASLERSRGYGRMLQGYELMFWNTLADL